MTLEEIKKAVKEGKTVHWANDGYKVTLYTNKNKEDFWCIVCSHNDNCIGLTWNDGESMNGKEEEFYIGD